MPAAPKAIEQANQQQFVASVKARPTGEAYGVDSYLLLFALDMVKR
jgi:hypothetical protein